MFHHRGPPSNVTLQPTLPACIQCCCRSRKKRSFVTHFWRLFNELWIYNLGKLRQMSGINMQTLFSERPVWCICPGFFVLWALGTVAVMELSTQWQWCVGSILGRILAIPYLSLCLSKFNSKFCDPNGGQLALWATRFPLRKFLFCCRYTDRVLWVVLRKPD